MRLSKYIFASILVVGGVWKYSWLFADELPQTKSEFVYTPKVETKILKLDAIKCVESFSDDSESYEDDVKQCILEGGVR